jgi:hypothetical protein
MEVSFYYPIFLKDRTQEMSGFIDTALQRVLAGAIVVGVKFTKVKFQYDFMKKQ